jgi:hypothetical protein
LGFCEQISNILTAENCISIGSLFADFRVNSNGTARNIKLDRTANPHENCSLYHLSLSF